jgi:hypothetical protein
MIRPDGLSFVYLIDRRQSAFGRWPSPLAAQLDPGRVREIVIGQFLALHQGVSGPVPNLSCPESVRSIQLQRRDL